jgi:hypothetical protein
MGDDKEDDKGKGKNAAGFTDEQREEIGRAVNAAVTAQLARKLPEAITQGMQPVLDRLDKIGGKGGQAAGGGDDDEEENAGVPPKGKKGKAAAKEEDPEVATMKARLKAIEDERVKERTEARIAKRDGELKELLTSGKVDPLRVKGALAVIAGNLKENKDGTYTYTAQRDGYVDDLSLADGVKEWLGSDEGKAYVVAQQRPGGAGTAPRAATLRTGGAPQKDASQQRADRKSEAVAKLGGQIQSLIANGPSDD